MIALKRDGSELVAVARFARISLRVSVVILLALVTFATTESIFTLAFASVDVTSGTQRPDLITSAIFATLATGNLPMVLNTTRKYWK